MAERHSRSGDPNQAIAEVRGLDDYEGRDWSPQPTRRFRRTPDTFPPVICGAPVVCRLCDPAEGYVCSFHWEDG